MPRHQPRPRRPLRRSALLSLPTAVALVLVPIAATPLGGPTADGQRPANAVSAAVPPAAPQPMPFEKLPGAGQALQRKPTPAFLLTGYRWPLPKGRLTNPFGAEGWGDFISNGEHVHDGIDLATFCGDRIVAAHDGTVLTAGRHYAGYLGWKGDLGPYTRRLDRKRAWFTLPIVVVIDDGNTYRSMYAHFGRVVVKRGQIVKAGQLLGYEGATGHATGCHLHYGLFSPLEAAVFRLDPGVIKRMKLPKFEIARIDPQQVLPPRMLAMPKPTTSAPKDSSATGQGGQGS